MSTQYVVSYPGRDAVLLSLSNDAQFHHLRAAAAAQLRLEPSSFTITLKGEPSLVLKEHMRVADAAKQLDTFALVPNDSDAARLGRSSTATAATFSSAAPAAVPASAARASSSSPAAGTAGPSKTAVLAASAATTAAAAASSVGSMVGSFFRRNSAKAVAGAGAGASGAGGAASVSEPSPVTGRPHITTATGVATATVAATPAGPAPRVAALTTPSASSSSASGGSGSADDEEQCSICLEPFVPEAPGFALACNPSHAFHAACLKEWTSSSNPSAKSCPLCRALIDLPSAEDKRRMMDPLLTAQAAGVAVSPGASASVIRAAADAAISAKAQGGVEAKRIFVRPNVLVLDPNLCLSDKLKYGPGTVVMADLKPPTYDEVTAHLKEVRASITSSADYRRIVQLATEFRQSRFGKALQATGKHVAAVSADLGRQAMDSLVASNSFTMGLASLTGYQVGQPSIRGSVLPGSNPAPAGSTAPSPAPRAGAGIGAAATPATATAVAASDLMRCPRCLQVISPPPGAPMFRCPCGATLSR